MNNVSRYSCHILPQKGFDLWSFVCHHLRLRQYHIALRLMYYKQCSDQLLDIEQYEIADQKIYL